MPTTPIPTEQAHIWQLEPGDLIQLSSEVLRSDPTATGPTPPFLQLTGQLHLCKVGVLCWGMPQTLMSVELLATGDRFILDLDTTTKVDRQVKA